MISTNAKNGLVTVFNAISSGTIEKKNIESNTKISAVGTEEPGPSAASVSPGPM